MGHKTQFYLECAKRAARGSFEGANVAATLGGGFLLFLFLQYFEILKEIGNMEAPTTVAGTVAFTLAMAVVSVGLAWLVIFLVRLALAPAELYAWLKNDNESLKKQLTSGLDLIFDRRSYGVELNKGEPLYSVVNIGVRNGSSAKLEECQVQAQVLLDGKSEWIPDHIRHMVSEPFTLRPDE